MGSGPDFSPPPRAPSPQPPDNTDEAEELARQRRELNKRRAGRTSLRIDPAISTAPANQTGLNIP